MSQERLFNFLRTQIDWAFSCDNKSCALEKNNVVSGIFGSKCLVPPWAFSQSRYVHAFNKLEPHEKTLVKLVVGLNVTSEDIVNLTVPLWFAFYKEYLVFHRLNSSSVPKAQHLLEFALINYKLSVAQQPLVATKTMMKAIGVKKATTFSRDWNPRLIVMNAVIRKMEHSALNKVASILNKKRKKYA